MKLGLIRTYLPNGTNGKILLNGQLVMYSIELPWKENRTGVSCIPEGKYELTKRWSPKFKLHFMLMDVPQREFILIHPANDAVKELKGCIAPVSVLTGAGKGSRSRMAMKNLRNLVCDALNRNDRVFIMIKKDSL